MSAVLNFFLIPASPAISLAAAASLLLALECFGQETLRRLKFVVSLAGPLAALAFTAWIWRQWPLDFSSVGYRENQVWLVEFGRHFHLDPNTLGIFAAIAAFALISLVFLEAYRIDDEVRTEILALVLFVACGMMLLVSADSLLMVFLALELLSLPTYVLVGIRRKSRESCEAALKYLLFGSFATVFLVFGIALLYSQFYTLRMPLIAEALAAQSAMGFGVATIAGLVLILVAVCFKIGIAPFHMWVPDAYEGAPASITGFMGSAVKLAAFGLVMRLLWDLFLPLSRFWLDHVLWLSVITMFVGNIAALAQTNLKRLFAYSSIAHAGYLLLGLTALPKVGGSASGPIFYYLVTYGVMFLGLFGCLAAIERRGEEPTFNRISGVGFTQPFFGACLALFSLSAAGIPLTAGFLAKYFVFLEVVRSGHTPFLIAGIASSIIGAYYYLRVLVYLYMKDNVERHAPVAFPSKAVAALVGLCAIAMLVFAIVPQYIGL